MNMNTSSGLTPQELADRLGVDVSKVDEVIVYLLDRYGADKIARDGQLTSFACDEIAGAVRPEPRQVTGRSLRAAHLAFNPTRSEVDLEAGRMTIDGNFIDWVSGGDGICRMKLQYLTQSIAGGPGSTEEECGKAATEPVTSFNEPHLICIHCLPKFLEMPETARLDVPR